MKRVILLLSLLFLPVVVLAQVNALSCGSIDVQNAINTATEGQTVNVPACPAGVPWTSGVTVSGKGIKIQGAGSGRIIAYAGNTLLTISTGTKTLPITS